MLVDIVMWVMTGVAIIGFYLNLRMNKWGYILWIVSNAGFVINNMYAKQYPQAGLFAFYVVACIFGFIDWSKKDADKKPKVIKTIVILTKTVDKFLKKGDFCICEECSAWGNQLNIKSMSSKRSIRVDRKEANIEFVGNIK